MIPEISESDCELLEVILSRAPGEIEEVVEPDFQVPTRTNDKVMALFSILIWPITCIWLTLRIVDFVVFSQLFASSTEEDARLCLEAEKGEIFASFACRRFKVEGVEGMILHRKDCQAKRWTAYHYGVGRKYEDYLREGWARRSIETISNQLDSHIVLFNYQGVSRDACIDGADAVLHFLEALGADEIVNWGYSLGGAISTLGMARHQEAEGVKYVSVNINSFSKLSSVVANYLGFSLPLVHWEMDARSASLALDHPQIIFYHHQDKMMRGNASLGRSLESAPLREIVCVGREDGALSDYYHHNSFGYQERVDICKRVIKWLDAQ